MTVLARIEDAGETAKLPFFMEECSILLNSSRSLRKLDVDTH